MGEDHNLVHEISQLHGQADAKILIQIFSPLILCFGTFGNVMILVILHRINFRNPGFAVFFGALIVSDLAQLYLALLPTWVTFVFDVTAYVKGSVGCKAWRWVYTTTSTMSPWYLSLMTFQRTSGVVCPHRSQHLTFGQSFRVVTAIGFMAGILNAAGETAKDECCCTALDWYPKGYMAWIRLSARFLIPTVCLVVGNTLVIRFIRKRQIWRVTAVNDTQFRKQQKVVTSLSRTLLTASLVYLFLACPLSIRDLIIGIGQYHEKNESKIIHTALFVMWYVNASLNFVVYCLTGSMIKNEFKAIVAAVLERIESGQHRATHRLALACLSAAACVTGLFCKRASVATARVPAIEIEEDMTSISLCTAAASEHNLVDPFRQSIRRSLYPAPVLSATVLICPASNSDDNMLIKRVASDKAGYLSHSYLSSSRKLRLSFLYRKSQEGTGCSKHLILRLEEADTVNSNQDRDLRGFSPKFQIHSANTVSTTSELCTEWRDCTPKPEADTMTVTSHEDAASLVGLHTSDMGL